MHDADETALDDPGTRADLATPPPSPRQPPIRAARVAAGLSASALVLATFAHIFLASSVISGATAQGDHFPPDWARAAALIALINVAVPASVMAICRAATPAWRRAWLPWTQVLGLSVGMTVFAVACEVATAVIPLNVVLALLLFVAHFRDGDSDAARHVFAAHGVTWFGWWTRAALFLAVIVFLVVAWPIANPILATTVLTVIGVAGLWISIKAPTIVHGRDVSDLHFDTVSPRAATVQHPVVFAVVPAFIVALVAGLPTHVPDGAHLILLVCAAFFATLSTGTLDATGGTVRGAVILALGISTVTVTAATASAGEWPTEALIGLLVGSVLVLIAAVAAAIRSARDAAVAAEYHAVPPNGMGDVLVATNELKKETARAPGIMIASLVFFFAGLVLVTGTALTLHDGLRADHFTYAITDARQHLVSGPLFGTHGVRGLDPCADTPFTRKDPHPSTNTMALVTGGAGFIGSHLVERLLSLGYRVRILDNLATGYLHNIAHLITHPAVEFIYGDIMDQDTILQAVQGVDYVFHLAAMSTVASSMNDPAMTQLCRATNVNGTVHVLNASRIAGVKKVVYAASSSYYGNGKMPMNEADAPDLLTPYAATKYEGEIQMDLYDRTFHLPTISVRLFMVYGPRQPTTGADASVTGVFLKKWMASEPLPIEGDGSHYRDFIHARDIAKALLLAQQSPHHGMVVNAGTGIGHSVQEVAGLVSFDQMHIAERNNDLVGTLADTCKAKNMLGFAADLEFTHEMAAMIEDAADPVAHLAQPDVQRMIEMHAAHPWLLPPGLLRPKYEPVVNDLATLAEMQEQDKRITVIPYQVADRPMLENLIYSLVKYGQKRNFLVAAIDDAPLASCLAKNLPCFNATAFAPATVSGEVHAGEGDGSALISWIKPRVVDALLRLGYTVHWTDTDLVYVRDVWATHLPWLDDVGADLAATYESSWSINTGNYVARPTPTTLNFFREYLSIMDRNPTIPEQTAFGTALRAHGGMCQTRATCAALKQAGKLALRDYSSAFGRTSSCSRDALDVCARHVLYVRPDCLAGQEAKKRKLVQLKVWFMREVCPAGAGEDPALRKGECMGVPSSLVSERSVLSEPASPAEERDCLGTAAQFTAEEPI